MTGLIIGAGPIGLCALAAVRHAGCEHIYVIAKYPVQITMANHFGATDIFPTNIEVKRENMTKIITKTNFDFCIDAVRRDYGMSVNTLRWYCWYPRQFLSWADGN